MRRKDREMNIEFSLEVIDNASFATISMIDNNGLAYGIPVSVVRENNNLYFHCAFEGKKIESIRNNNKVCLSFVNKAKPIPKDYSLEFESAVVFGRAYEVKDKDEKIHALNLICKKYASSNMGMFESAIERSLFRTNVIKIEMDNISGKRKKYD
ncbi:pyridoxamine 5'-phosphate oxidase family protein [Anaerofustis sp.]|uniref:pyridoxamine 5'-phosphate oxidase family protein n=1 Tax=Anaerofustis sp. TaxID=1872517 RepID=UPI0025C6A5F3|nr:pyridoxamine 5'-phosphate oxidase family protein [Anaerofustis sp.]